MPTPAREYPDPDLASDAPVLAPAREHPNPALPRSLPGPFRTRDGPDRGSGTVHGMTIAVTLCALLLVILLLAQAGITTHRAAKAADLAALAAADSARGLAGGIPCDVAAAVARENGAALDSCELVTPDNTTVDIRTSIALPGPLARLGPARGISRAGPPPGEP